MIKTGKSVKNIQLWRWIGEEDAIYYNMYYISTAMQPPIPVGSREWFYFDEYLKLHLTLQYLKTFKTSIDIAWKVTM